MYIYIYNLYLSLAIIKLLLIRRYSYNIHSIYMIHNLYLHLAIIKLQGVGRGAQICLVE